MKEEEFIPYQLALRLKKIGFNQECFGYFIDENLIIDNIIGSENVLYAPIFSQAFKWFKKTHDLVIESCVPFQRSYLTDEDNFEILEFGYRIYLFDPYRGGLRNKIEWDGYDNSDENKAQLACLEKLISIIEVRLKIKKYFNS